MLLISHSGCELRRIVADVHGHMLLLRTVVTRLVTHIGLERIQAHGSEAVTLLTTRVTSWPHSN